MRALRGSLFCLAGLVAAVPPAEAQTAGQFSAVPAVQFGKGRPPAQLAPLTVANTTRETYDVRVFPALLGQLVSGTFVVRERGGQLEEAARVLEVTPRRMRLGPGDRRTVRVRWTGVPPGAESLSGAVVVEGALAQREGSGVGARARILTLDFFRVSPRPTAPARFSDLRGEQIGPRRLQVVSQVANLGRNFASPREAKLTIFDAGRKVVFRKAWAGQRLDIVIGGYERDFPVEVTKVLPAGRYRVRTEMVFARRRYVREIDLRLTGPNELPTLKAEIVGVRGTGDVGEAAVVRTTVANLGNVPLRPTVETALVRLRSTSAPRRTLGSRTVRGPVIPPGERTDITTSLGRLEEGSHEAFVTLSADGRRLARGSARIVAVPDRSFWQRYGTLIVVLLALAALLALAYVLRDRLAGLIRRGGSPKPAVPARSPGGPAVDLNTATAAELQTLPGVGPRAAARIVEHRDEYGPFDTVDALAGVEGFDRARVDALRRRARV